LPGVIFVKKDKYINKDAAIELHVEGNRKWKFLYSLSNEK